MNGPQKPLGGTADAQDMIPLVEGGKDYFCIADHQGRPTLCKFDMQGNQWRIMSQADIQRMLTSAGASNNLMNMLR